MQALLIALGAGVAFLIAYHTYGRWLGVRIFRLAAGTVCPSVRLRDDKDYVPTPKPIVFGHHFTSIAGTGPIVGPAIAVMWGWLPALLWVVVGSIFIGAVHDFGALVVSLRNNGQTVGDIAGRVLNPRVRLLFLLVLFMALTIVLAIFGLVIAAVFRMYPASIVPCTVQIPIAILIGLYLHRKGIGIFWPSLIALALMYLTVIFGDVGVLGGINAQMAGWPTMVWVAVLLVYSYVASVLPVWTLLQPRDYINSLQLISALVLIVAGLGAAAFFGGAAPVEGAGRQPLEIVAPMWNFSPKDAPMIFPFLFITIACGAISGFHCLVSSGTSSKQLKSEPDARFVAFGGMLTEGFLATLVILACVAGLGLGITERIDYAEASTRTQLEKYVEVMPDGPGWLKQFDDAGLVFYATGKSAWQQRYSSWSAAGGLPRTVGAFVDGSANFLKAIGIPAGVAIALMGVLVASFAGTTLDTACRLQRYVVQELAATFVRKPGPDECKHCGYDLTGNVSGRCSECGAEMGAVNTKSGNRCLRELNSALNPFVWLTHKHLATIFAIVIAAAMAALPGSGEVWSWRNAGSGGMILWPMFGATNQLLGGLSFLVITFYLWRRRLPIWFIVLPLVFMLIMPAWAMVIDLPRWWEQGRYVLVLISGATIALEAWMIVEAVLLWPKVQGVLEPQLDGAAGQPAVEGVNC